MGKFSLHGFEDLLLTTIRTGALRLVSFTPVLASSASSGHFSACLSPRAAHTPSSTFSSRGKCPLDTSLLPLSIASTLTAILAPIMAWRRAHIPTSRPSIPRIWHRRSIDIGLPGMNSGLDTISERLVTLYSTLYLILIVYTLLSVYHFTS